MQFNIIFKTIFEYIHKKFRFVHTNTFCKYRKKLRASPRVHLVMHYFDRLSLKSTTICYKKNIDYSYTPGYILAMWILLPEKF